MLLICNVENGLIESSCVLIVLLEHETKNETAFFYCVLIEVPIYEINNEMHCNFGHVLLY